MTRFFSWNKDPWEGFWSNQWSCVGGNDSPFTEAAAEEKTPHGQPLLPDRREEVVRKKRGERRGSLFPHPRYRKEDRKQRGGSRGKRERRREKKRWRLPPIPVPLAGIGGCGAAGVAVTGRSQAGSPWGAIWVPGSWFPEGRSCSCSVLHGASLGKDPSRAEGSRPASDAARVEAAQRGFIQAEKIHQVLQWGMGNGTEFSNIGCLYSSYI